MCDREKNIRSLGERVTRPIPTDDKLDEVAWNGYKNVLNYASSDIRAVDGDPVMIIYHTVKARKHGEEVALCSVVGDLVCSVYLLHKMFKTHVDRCKDLRELLKTVDEDHCTLSGRFEEAVKKIDDSTTVSSDILKSVEQAIKLVDEIKKVGGGPARRIIVPEVAPLSASAASLPGSFDVEDRVKTLERNVKCLRQTYLDDFQDRLDKMEKDVLNIKKQYRELGLDDL